MTINPQTYQFTPFGAIKPSGWIRAQMQHDLEHGFVGHLDELVPGLIQRDDIYGADRLTKAAKTKELGVVARESQWEVQFLWWNSETQSNWLDGLARAALLLDQPDFIEKARARLEHLLATQDDDGYLGIYAPDLRYNFSGENGELWAQASLFRALLGWHEATGDERALAAIRRAVEVTMRAWPIGESHPFDVQNDFAGVGHGLVFTDILDRLHQLTGDERYPAYARWLYLEYSRQPLSQDDLQLAHLLDRDYRFKAHGVHTYEQIRSLLTAACAADDPQLDSALAAALAKLETCLTPSGGPIGDEFIGRRAADASETGYEYCSIHELLDTYTQLLQKTGEMKWADHAEWLFFNAAQGARHPHQSANVPPICGGIAYLKTDNSLSMTGPLHPDDPQDSENPQIRYKYSPAHQDVAVCCVPNAGRIAPYYVKAQWLRSAGGLVAALYGASSLQTQVNGVSVNIIQETDYPFDTGLTFRVETAQPTEFRLSFRIPAWASGFSLGGESFTVQDNLIHLQKTWQTGDTVTLRFDAEVKIQPWRDENIVTYGPLLFCLPLEGEFSPGREYAPGFRDSYYAPADLSALSLRLAPQTDFTLEKRPFDPSRPFDSLLLTGELLDPGKNPLPVHLIPLGASILRKVTFETL
jgi:DUF1680 family protein